MVAVATWLLAIVLVVAARKKYDPKYGRQNILLGQRNEGKDKLLFHDNPAVEGKWFPFPKVQSTDVCYPPQGAPPSEITITFFKVSSQTGDGDGGYAFITDGGVGAHWLCLHLMSKRGKGFNFIVDIWGEPANKNDSKAEDTTKSAS